MSKTYLGDGVYVDRDEIGRLVLTADLTAQAAPTHRIILEPEVLLALLEWLQRHPDTTSAWFFETLAKGA